MGSCQQHGTNNHSLISKSLETIRYAFIGLVFLTLFSSKKLVDFSPYDANTSYRDVNPQDLDKITSQQWEENSLVYIAISDPHTQYSDLRDAVGAINQMEGISFVMVCGDITDGAWLRSLMITIIW